MKFRWLLGILVLGAVSVWAEPNVVVCMADDVGVGRLNAYGAPESLLKTPHLDDMLRV